MRLAHVVDGTPRNGWGGGGGDVNVPCDLLTLLMVHTLDMSVIKGVKFKTKQRDDLL